MDRTVVKALDVVEALARSERPLGVTELSRQLGMTKSNVHRLLKTLQRRRYVRQSAQDTRYELSLRLWELGSLVLSRLDPKRVATSHLVALAERTRETVHLSVLDGTEVVYVDKIDSPEPVRAYSQLGGRAPAWSVATGKAMLAYAGQATIDSVVAALVPFTARTLRTEAALRRELARIRAAGLAKNLGEWRAAVVGCAAPIRDATGEVVAAVGISGPAERLKPRLDAFAPLVVATARGISTALGHVRCLGHAQAARGAVGIEPRALR